jgi:hypothetical protein
MITMENANINDIIVLIVIGSDLNIYVNTLNTNIPHTKEMNRVGQNSPLNPLTAIAVASMNTQDTGIPNNINRYLYCLAQGHRMDPLI